MKFSAVVLLPLLLARSAAASSAHSSRQLRLVRAPTTSADATGEDRQLRSGGHTDHSHSRSVGAGSHGSASGVFSDLTALAGTAPTIEQCEVLMFAPGEFNDAARACYQEGGYVLNWQSEVDEPAPLAPGVNNVCCPAKDIDVDELKENEECTKVTGGPCADGFEGWNVLLGGGDRYCCEGSVVPSSSSSRTSDDSSGSSSRSSSRSSSTSSSDTTTAPTTAAP